MSRNVSQLKILPKSEMLSNLETVWDREYSEAQVIPSTTREAPAHALELFSELLGFRKMESAFDAGCGNGRNAIYLALLGLRVEAIDFSSVAVAEVKARAESAGVPERIHVGEGNLKERLPLETESFDLCLDFYVLCHFLDEEVKRHYVSELWRLTKPGGYVISALFSPMDQYYARLIHKDQKRLIVEDPANGIVKQLYTNGEFKKLFSPPFEIKYFVTFEFDDVVQGESYHRDILTMVLQKHSK